ncbi:MAG TPA: Trm112 family protein [Terracidiphilus sp.]|nr:Trm112 family protein [Terracidiphilus sp.]
MPKTDDNWRGFAEWAEVLACPACLGALRAEPNAVTCVGCGRVYPVVDGIPVLIVERAEPKTPRA